jgi:D-proline reductase (dithiol) PrdB
MTPVRAEEHAMSDAMAGLGLAAEDDVPIPYMQRIRDYYQGLGYSAPYRWAHYAEVPFTPLRKPLADSRIGLVTTAAPYRPDQGDQGPGAPYNAAAKFYTVYSGASASDHDLRISHVAYDRAHTTAEDTNSWFPLRQLRRLAAAGRIGEVAPRFHGTPTDRSQRTTIDRDCPEILARVREDKADAVILVAV